MNKESDWLQVIREHTKQDEAEFELAQLRPGDRLDVVTRHTTYRFMMITEREADLDSGRKDRPYGRVHIQGCAFGSSQTIKPGHLFCGGSLEFNFRREGVLMDHRTTPIAEIRHLRAGAGQPGKKGNQA